MFRIVEFARKGVAVSLADECLLVRDGDAEPVSVPLVDVSAVLIADPALSLTAPVLYALADHSVPLVCCDRTMMPAAILSGTMRPGSDSDRLLRAQFAQTSAAKARLWRRIIRAKIEGQAYMLRFWRDSHLLDPLPGTVRNGDTGNVEARAASLYWRELGLFEKRSRGGTDANAFFNYGYTVLFAAFAREIAVAGLLPRFGFFHRCRDNVAPLASDLMEAFRPAIDHAVISLFMLDGADGLTPEGKRCLLKRIYAESVRMPAGERALFTAVRDCVQSCKRMFLANNQRAFLLPEWKG